MSRVTGVIAEYNPFHNGHSHQLSEARKLSGASHVVVVMSGSFTQRGDPAVADKFVRAAWALRNGADIVLELPCVFACANSQRFAEGGIGVLCGTGVADALSFGAETPDINLLTSAAKAVSSADGAVISNYLSSGLSYPAAIAKAAGKEFEKVFTPNNILAMEYIKAVMARRAALDLVPVCRKGPGHDSAVPAEGFASASFLRSHPDEIGSFAPEDVICDMTLGNVPHIADDPLFTPLMLILRRMSREQLADLPDVTEGLENLIYKAARNADDTESLISMIKSRRYTRSRIKRILACALLGITNEIQREFDSPLYIRVLGVRHNSISLLAEISKASSLPVIISKSDMDLLDKKALRMLEYDILAREIQHLAFDRSISVKNEFSLKLLTI